MFYRFNICKSAESIELNRRTKSDIFTTYVQFYGILDYFYSNLIPYTILLIFKTKNKTKFQCILPLLKLAHTYIGHPRYPSPTIIRKRSLFNQHYYNQGTRQVSQTTISHTL